MADMAQPRFVIVYEERRIALFEGETILGRALTCHVRFNAPTVSREHLKLHCEGGQLVAENLSSTVGTRVNGQPINSRWTLRHGDELTMGSCKLRIERVDTAIGDLSGGGAVPPEDDGLPEESTMPGHLGQFDEYAAVAPHQFMFHTCPTCRNKVAFRDTRCDKCGYVWPSSHPGAVTQRTTVPQLAAVIGTPAIVPLVYSSDELTIDVNVDELRRDGVFIPSQLLDPTGTSCELTLLPDGEHPMTVQGTVITVRAIADVFGPAGMNVDFVSPPPIVQVWIDRWLQAHPRKR
jgi:hypothetical protein